MTFKCVAIDDEPLAISLITNYISQMPELKLLHAFEDAITGGEFMRSSLVDILFIDINMPDISGLTLVQSLETKPAVIFTTAYKKFAFDGFELEAVDYLLKPISFERFEKAVRKAMVLVTRNRQTAAEEPETLFVYSEYKQVKIELQAIDYIEAREDYVLFHYLHAKPVMSLMTLKSVQEKVAGKKFIRIHRSYIVPINAIKQVTSKKVLLTSGRELPVGNSYALALQAVTNK